MFDPERNGAANLSADLRATLNRAVELMEHARDPWFIIGSAAAALAGLAGEPVADVDILAGSSDLERVAQRLGMPHRRPDPSERFRSDRLLNLPGAPLMIEIMAGLQVRTVQGWVPVTVEASVAMPWGKAQVLIPTARDQARICHLFGRPKDLRRAARLEGLGP